MRDEGEAKYERLRTQALTMRPEQIELGLELPQDSTTAFGVVMDTDVDGETATLVAYATGDASLYLSTGGGVIGGFAHANVVTAAKEFVTQAQRQLGELESTRECPRPGAGEVRFYVLTTTGILTATCPESWLAEERSPLSSLFYAGHEVITELRVTGSLAGNGED